MADDKVSKVPVWTWWISGGTAVLMSVIIMIVLWPESKPSASTKTSAAAAQTATDFPLCADGEYNFSNLDIKKVGEVKFPVKNSCWVKITLPSKDCVTHDPTVEVRRVWDNGTTDIDGPNRVVQSRTGRIIFVKSLREDGVYKILARK